MSIHEVFPYLHVKDKQRRRFREAFGAKVPLVRPSRLVDTSDRADPRR
jgi:hypothetical protein